MNPKNSETGQQAQGHTVEVTSSRGSLKPRDQATVIKAEWTGKKL